MIIVFASILFTFMPQFSKAETTLAQLYSQTAVISSMALASSAACFFGVMKTLHAMAKTSNKERFFYIRYHTHNDGKPLEKPIKEIFRVSNREEYHFITHTPITQFQLNIPEAFQGLCLFGTGVLGLWGTWKLAEHLNSK